MSDETSLGDRMKGYEHVWKQHLIKRTPVIIRIDGKSFHSFTTGMDIPFDHNLMHTMLITAGHCVNAMQGAVFAYVQSDEISILLKDWKRLNTQAWFDNNLQKIASISASVATVHFNMDILSDKLAFFDARAFNIPKEEVCNYFIWRQQDATRNSIQMVGHAYFSHEHLYGKTVDDIQHMLITEKDINWNDFSVRERRGACIIGKEPDINIPIFTQNREYIEDLLLTEE